jgi:pentose-5-phosphate-3-epimerase
MDGGIERDNIRSVVASGVSVCVVGSAIFSATDPVARMSELRTSARSETA